MKIIKSTISILLILMLLSVSIVPVFAVEVPSSGILNIWNNDYFKSIFNLDREKFKNFESLVDEKLQDRKVNNSLMYFQSKLDYDSRFFIVLTDGLISVEHTGSNLFKDVVSDCTYVLFLQVNYNDDRDVYFNQSDLIETTSYSFNLVGFSDKISNCYTAEDVEFSNNSSLTFYKADNIYYDFLDWIKGYNFYDVAKTTYNNFIYFYDWLDSFKGKYNYNMYTDILDDLDVYDTDDLMLNYLNSSVSFKDALYYTSNCDSNYNDDSTQHSETLTFYLKFNSEMQNKLNSLYRNNVYVLEYSECKNDIENYLLDNAICTHYEKGKITFYNWYKDYVVKRMPNGSKYFSLHIIRDSNAINSTATFYLKWDMPNNYSFICNSDTGSSIMSGCRTASSAKLFNPDTGFIDNSAGGLGSNIDNSDLGVKKDKSTLLNNGWKNGYPNQSGNYPYTITVYENGSELMKFYFKSKPFVNAYGYTDTQIKYSIDISNVVGYAYLKNYNISYSYDVHSLVNDLNKARSSLDVIYSTISAGLDVTSLISGSLPLNVISTAVNLFDFLDSIGNNSSDFISTFDIVLWTNYVGTPNKYKGYRCIFNWNIGVDDAFIRDNSDDTHDYSNDYIKNLAPGEVPTGSSDGNTYNTWNYYYDNNGNVHGGGDDTYIATEPPTVVNTKLAEYEGYDFDDVLTVDNTNSFFNFIRQAFSFMPAWVWFPIAASFAVLVILRILRR